MARIGVIGGSQCTPRGRVLAREVGALIAAGGHTLVCGGRTGVMEAACAGARSAGGLTVGILPGGSDREANPDVAVAIPTGLGVARNTVVATSSDVLIAIEGAYGTLSEMAFGLSLGRTVIALESWDIAAFGRRSQGFMVARTPAEAYALAEQALAAV